MPVNICFDFIGKYLARDVIESNEAKHDATHSNDISWHWCSSSPSSSFSSFSPVLLFFFCRLVIVKWQCCSSENDLHVRENMLVAERTQNSTSHSPFDHISSEREILTQHTERNEIVWLCISFFFFFPSSNYHLRRVRVWLNQFFLFRLFFNSSTARALLI